LAVADRRLRRWRLWFLALSNAPHFSSVLSQFKKYHSSENLKFDNLGIFPSLELRILVEKVLSISPKLNFNPNLGCYGS